MADKIDSNSLQIIITESNGALIYSNTVHAVSSVNEKGEFDVLPYHVNFISIVHDKIIIHELSGERKEFTIDRGLLSVYKNKVEVFLGIEVK